MSARKINFRQRKDVVLGIVVNEYIKTVNPVSSNYILNGYALDLSSATIRNILAELEQDGFLTHPHTSAGRVPTQDGYRYYVDNLMKEIQLLEEEKKLIKEEYEQKIQDLETVLEKTSEVISDVTHYTSIITVDGWDNRIYYKGADNIISYLDIQDIQKVRDILRALERKEQILEILNRELRQKIKVYIGHEIASSMMGDCSLVVSPYETNKGLTGRLAVLGPTYMDYSRVVSALEYFSGLIGEVV